MCHPDCYQRACALNFLIRQQINTHLSWNLSQRAFAFKSISMFFFSLPLSDTQVAIEILSFRRRFFTGPWTRWSGRQISRLPSSWSRRKLTVGPSFPFRTKTIGRFLVQFDVVWFSISDFHPPPTTTDLFPSSDPVMFDKPDRHLFPPPVDYWNSSFVPTELMTRTDWCQ